MALVITVKVFPSAGKQKCILDKSSIIKCYLKSPPEAGKANHELVRFFSHALKIPLASVELVSGQTSRTKRLKICTDITYEKLLEVLGLEVICQLSIGNFK